MGRKGIVRQPEFGELLRIQRVAQGLNHEEAAKRAEMHRVSWTRIENGSVTPADLTAIRMARALGLGTEEVIRLMKPRQESGLVPCLVSSPAVSSPATQNRPGIEEWLREIERSAGFQLPQKAITELAAAYVRYYFSPGDGDNENI